MRTAWIDTVFTAFLALLGCWIIYHAFRFGIVGPTGIGGGLFPLVAGSVILGCSLASLRGKVAQEEFAGEVLDWATLRPVALMVAATALFILLIPIFGMIFLTFPYVMAISYVIERPTRLSGHLAVLALALATTTALYCLFSLVLNIPLPWGMFEE